MARRYMSGTNDWGYSHKQSTPGVPPSYREPYQQPHNQNMPFTNTSDPWNWGWDESNGSGESSNNNSQPDPKWDWSVDGSSGGYQDHVPNPTANYMQPGSGQQTWPNRFSSNNISHTMVPSTQDVISESFNTTSVINQHPYGNQRPLFHPAENPNMYPMSYSHGNHEHQYVNNSNNSTEQKDFHSTGVNQQPLYFSGFHPSENIGQASIGDGMNSMIEGSTSLEINKSLSYASSQVEVKGVPEIPLENQNKSTDTSLHAGVGYRSAFGNDVLSPQWSTESLPSQGSDELQPVMDNSANRHCEISSSMTEDIHANPLTIGCESYEPVGNNHIKPSTVYNFSQDDIHSSGVQEGQINSDISTRCDVVKEPLSVYMSPEQYFANSSPNTHVEKIQSEQQQEVDNSVMGSSSYFSPVDNISENLQSLSLNVINRDVENVEVAPPEKSTSPKILPVSVATSMPPPVPTPPLGKGALGSANPYAARGRSLSHKYANKSRSHIPANLVSATETEADSWSFNKNSSTNNIHAEVDISHSGYSKEKTPIIGSGPSGVFNTENRAVSGEITEDSVNLETVPDNKERPDVDVLQETSSTEHVDISRFHGDAGRQDTVPMHSLHWPQETSLPENQEVYSDVPHTQYTDSADRENCNLDTSTRGGLTRQRVPGSDDEQYLSSVEPGLDRIVPGQGEDNTSSGSAVLTHSHNFSVASNNNLEDIAQRQVPGHQDNASASLTVSGQSVVTNNTVESISSRAVPGRVMPGEVNMPPITSSAGSSYLHRTVPGQTSVSQIQSNVDIPASQAEDDIPPPGLSRMVPGESRGPEGQVSNEPSLQAAPDEPRVVTGIAEEGSQSLGSGCIVTTTFRTVPDEPRVVTGVAQDELDNNMGQLTSPVSSVSLPSASSDHETTDLDVGGPESAPTSLVQLPSERSETIGSDCIETFPTGPTDSAPRRDTEGLESQRRSGDDMDSGSEIGRGHHSSGRTLTSRDREPPHEHLPESRRYREERDHRHFDREDRLYEHDERDECDTSPRNRRYPLHRERRYDDPDYNSRRHYEDQARHGRRSGGRERDRDRDRERERDRDHDRSHDPNRDRYERSHYPPDREFRHGEYYPRYEDYYSQRSRPSSRSGPRSEYDDDRRRDFQRYGAYYYPHPMYGHYNYQYYLTWQYMQQQQQQQQLQLQQQSHLPSSLPEDRGSVHSGRSSAHDDLARSNLDRSAEHNVSVVEGTTSSATPQRFTPVKFSTAHVKGVLTHNGQLVNILPHYPLDGQPAVVEIYNIDNIIGSTSEFQAFPGPLIKGVTHKKSLMNFCMKKIKTIEQNTDLVDRDSAILLWRLLLLLLRQNGTVVGTDIAELLLATSPQETDSGNLSSMTSTSGSRHQGPSPVSVTGPEAEEKVPNISSKPLNEEELTNNFREYLLYGNTQEALEWAMKHGLWGHALFLASKMDSRTYANVMTRFANGLTLNDPLQTLYQLMSGRLPAAVTCCADERWGDWRPHLAMILSNSSSQPDLDHRAITTLGDTLASRGCLYASHFCYLMAQLEFGFYNQKSSKLVLLGSSHSRPFNEFANNEAIQMTEIYIYACQLADPHFELPQFQAYKFLYAQRLLEAGMPMAALQYVEVIARTVTARPSVYCPNFMRQVFDLGNRLKVYDLSYGSDDKEELPWLLQLQHTLDDYMSGAIQPDGPSYGSTSNLSLSEVESLQHQVNSSEIFHQQDHHLRTEQQHLQQQQQQIVQPLQDTVSSNELQSQEHVASQVSFGVNSSDVPQNLLMPDLGVTSGAQQGGQATWSGEYQNTQYTDTGSMQLPDAQGRQLYWPQQHWETGPSQDLSTANDVQIPQTYDSGDGKGATNKSEISSPDSFNYYSQQSSGDVPVERASGDLSQPLSAQQSTKSRISAPSKSKSKKESVNKAPSTPARSSWFGGLWNKLAMRPKNQMILPEDKEPKIVWSAEKQRWINTEADEDEDSGDLPPPPPKASEIPVKNSSVVSNQSLPIMNNGDVKTVPPAGQNIYKMNRARGSRANYVDVFGGVKTSQPFAPSELFPPVTSGGQTNAPKFFVPPPVHSDENAPVDFLMSAPSRAPDNSLGAETSELSRWSSTSSLSKEVQRYMEPSTENNIHNLQGVGGHVQPQYVVPQMYNPSIMNQLPSLQISNASGKKRYPN